MNGAKFYAHILAVLVLVDGPLWGIDWAIGVVFLPVLVGFVEIIHGMFDEILEDFA